MQMVVLLHEQHICYGEKEKDTDEVYPMCKYGIGNKVYKAKGNGELQKHIEARYLYMPDFKLIRHNLIRMLSMRLPQILMKHDAVADG